MKTLSFTGFNALWPQLTEIDITGDRNDWKRVLQDESGERRFVYRQWTNGQGATVREFFELQGETEFANWKTVGEKGLQKV